VRIPPRTASPCGAVLSGDEGENEESLRDSVVALVVGPLWLAGCGTSVARRVEPQSKPSAAHLVRTAALPVSPGSRVTLMRFAGTGRFEVSCGERPRVAFRVEDKTAAVGVDTDRSGARVRTVDPGERLRTRLSPSALQRWHVVSSHGDGVRVATASVAVTPVRGGRGACLFSAQSIRSGAMP
jgi:hypothetical protein